MSKQISFSLPKHHFHLHEFSRNARQNESQPNGPRRNQQHHVNDRRITVKRVNGLEKLGNVCSKHNVSKKPDKERKQTMPLQQTPKTMKNTNSKMSKQTLCIVSEDHSF
jgi:hypothetical protein